MSDPKQEESFKVVDRRLFKEDGEIRQEVVDQEKRDEEIAAKRAASAPREAAKPAAQGAPKEAVSAAPQQSLAQNDAGMVAPGEPTAAQQDDAPSRSFQILVDFLARNAAAMLGGMADPRTGQPFLDLEGAHEMIDMLDVLREKTRGNLAKSDDDLLVEVLGGLKLTYVEISKAAADAMAKKAVAKK